MSAITAFVVTTLQLVLLPIVAVFALLAHLITFPLDTLFRRKRLPPPKSIVITGATAGIGRALALHYAKPGVTLALTGRNKQNLDDVARECEGRGATVKKGQLDVTDREGMAKFLLAVDKAAPVDCVIANAGVSESVLKLERELEEATRALFSINVDGVFNTVLPLLAPMRERRTGRIVIMSSAAASVPLPGGVAYSATKAAVRTYGEALRAAVYRDGLRVNVICPGYVESDMTAANKASMGSLMSMKTAVRIMTRGISDDVPVLQFPAGMHTGLWVFGRVLPPNLLHTLSHRRLIPGLGYFKAKRGPARK